MAAQESFEEPATFQEVSVSLTEEKEFALDPYLFALSGNDIQQYCTILSLRELENFKPEISLETPQGISMPLSLVQVSDEFEVSQDLYQGDDGTAQTKLLQGSGGVSLVRLQYHFAPVSEGGVLQGYPPTGNSLTASELQQETKTRSSKLVSMGENCSNEEIQTRRVSELWPTGGRKLELDSNPTTFQLASSEKKSLGYPDRGCSFSCSTVGLTEYQIIPAAEWDKLLRQLNFSHRPCQKDVRLEKSFKCPDCGKGFVHRSSIARHQRLHRKENSCPLSGQKRSLSPGLKSLSPPEPPSREEKTFHHPPGETGQINGSATKPSDLRDQCASTLNSLCVQTDSPAPEPCRNHAVVEKPFCCFECGKRFTVKSTVVRHQMLHREERPFKCLYCDKSYIQKSHLRRHNQMKHSDCLFQREMR